MAKKKNKYKEKLLELIDQLEDDDEDDEDDSDDVITLRGPAARKLLGIDPDEKPAGKKDGDDSDDGGEPDPETGPQRGQSRYFKS